MGELLFAPTFSFVPIKQIIIIFVLGIKKFNELTKNGG